MIKRFVGKALMWLVFAGALLYLGDWAVWKMKVARGGGMGTVKVSQFTVAPLKGHREEYYYDGVKEVSCSRSIFPQTSGGACWWVQGHQVVFDRSITPQ